MDYCDVCLSILNTFQAVRLDFSANDPCFLTRVLLCSLVASVVVKKNICVIS